MRRPAVSFAATTAAAILCGAAALAQNPPTATPVRLSMEELHRTGGVPPGWILSPPAGEARRGRDLFERHGCHACHAVAGEGLPAPTGP